MDSHKTDSRFPERVTTEIVKLRVKGHSHAEIADQVADQFDIDRPSKERVRLAYLDELERQRDEAGMEDGSMVELQKLRLSRALLQCEKAMQRIDEELEVLEAGDDPTATASLLRERRQAADTMRKLSESYRKMFGLDQPKEVQHEVQVETEYNVQLPSADEPDQIEETEQAEVIDAEYEEDPKQLEES